MKSKPTEQAYGGFLELEVGSSKEEYHKGAIKLSHGRACLSYILDEEKPRRVHVPFYTCGAMLEPLLERKIDFTYYAVDPILDPIGLPDNIPNDELIIYINYFGLKSQTMERLIDQYGNRLVADNCMSFFSRQYGDSYTYNSCRKFFGVPDGSYLYTPKPITRQFDHYESYHYEHLISRLLGKNEVYYNQFLKNEATFNCGIHGMSAFTERLMATIDFEGVTNRRRYNYQFVHEHLKKENLIQLSMNSKAVPHYYPFLTKNKPSRSLLAKNNLFIPTLWPDMLKRPEGNFEHEVDLAKNLLPIPIDQRYTTEEMEQILNILKRNL